MQNHLWRSSGKPQGGFLILGLLANSVTTTTTYRCSLSQHFALLLPPAPTSAMATFFPESPEVSPPRDPKAGSTGINKKRPPKIVLNYKIIFSWLKSAEYRLATADNRCNSASPATEHQRASVPQTLLFPAWVQRNPLDWKLRDCC